jgi:hypothetical protein
MIADHKTEKSYISNMIFRNNKLYKSIKKPVNSNKPSSTRVNDLLAHDPLAVFLFDFAIDIA